MIDALFQDVSAVRQLFEKFVTCQEISCEVVTDIFVHLRLPAQTFRNTAISNLEILLPGFQ